LTQGQPASIPFPEPSILLSYRLCGTLLLRRLQMPLQYRCSHSTSVAKAFLDFDNNFQSIMLKLKVPF
jgi:hypothetical protein